MYACYPLDVAGYELDDEVWNVSYYKFVYVHCIKRLLLQCELLLLLQCDVALDC